MTHHLHEEDILNILGDGTVSDLDLSDDDDDDNEHESNNFPHEQLETLLNEFDDHLFDTVETIENDEYDTVSSKKDIRWVQMPFKPPNINLRNIEDDFLPDELPSPLNYFIEYFGDTHFENMAYFTNLYAIQNQNKFKPTSVFEIKNFIGIQLIMGSLKFPRVRMYWEQNFQIQAVCDNMTRDRFFALRSNFHVIDNQKIPKNNKDKFVKVRPLYDILKKNVIH